MERLSESFADIVDTLALETWYEDIEYDDLDDDQKASVDALNLEDLLTEQLNRENIDIRLPNLSYGALANSRMLM